MILNIEDVILHICDPINGLDHSKIEPRDKGVLFSLACQLRKCLPFTENQASLALKILERTQDSYNTLSSIKTLVETPIYKYPFRIIDPSKKISLVTSNSTLYLSIKFPFNHKINNALASVTKKVYDKSSKAYLLQLTESNIVRAVECLKEFDFDIDHTVNEYYEKILEIKKNPDLYHSQVDFQKDFVFNNFSKSMTDFFKLASRGKFMYDLFLCKLMSISFSNNLKEKIKNTDTDLLTKKILLSGDNRFHIKTFNNIDITKTLALIDHWPILIVMPDDTNSTNNISQWIKSFNTVGLNNKDISVLFRSQREKSFNEFVKDNQLNNLITKDTKVVFIKHKIPKILYRINFYPRIIISLSGFYAHFTNQKMVDSHPLVLYYNSNQSVSISGKNKIVSL